MDKIYKTGFLICFLLFVQAIGFSQDISGVWTGNYGRNLLTPQPLKLVVEINVYNDSVISGLSHIYYKNNKYEHYTIHGVFRKRDSSFVFSEDSALAIRLGFGVSNCLGKYKTTLRITDSGLRQEGRWRDKEILGCPSTTVWLEKRLNIPQRDKVSANTQTIDTGIVTIPKKILQRETDIQNLLEIPAADKDSIKITLYDNGIVDGDSVSLYLDNKEILSHRRISTDPIVFYISLGKENPLAKLRLVAESLGTIPPCTAVMVVTTRHKRYEMNLSSSFDKNAAVEFFLKD